MSKNVEFPKGVDLLTIRPVPELLSTQVAKFTPESLRVRVAEVFDPSLAQNALKNHDRQEIVVIDLGGDKVVAAKFQIRAGELRKLETLASLQSHGGKSYLSLLEDVAADTSFNSMSVGISMAGPIEGTKSLASVNLSNFLEEFKSKYDCDFAKLFPTLAWVSNDMVACMVAGAVEAKKQFPQASKVLLIGNGSGFGGAVLKDEKIIAIEPGHVELISDLNPYGQDKPCGLFGAKFVCSENVAASKAGVESLWLKIKGESLNGRQISVKYMQGDPLATELYDNSAIIVAHAIKGIADVLKLFKEPNDTAIVCHGGIFNVSGYSQRIQQVLQKDLGYSPTMVLTRNFSQNACLEGAALAALVKP